MRNLFAVAPCIDQIHKRFTAEQVKVLLKGLNLQQLKYKIISINSERISTLIWESIENKCSNQKTAILKDETKN